MVIDAFSTTEYRNHTLQRCKNCKDVRKYFSCERDFFGGKNQKAKHPRNTENKEKRKGKYQVLFRDLSF